VQRNSLEPVLIQLFAQPVCAVFGAGEDEHLLPVSRANLVRQQLPFAALVDGPNHLVNSICRSVSSRSLDFNRRIEQIGCKVADFL
jgi:hypothetical protein